MVPMLFFAVQVGSSIAGVIVATVVLRRTWSYIALRRKGLREPPGPPPYLILGNLLDLPQKDIHIGFARMAELYGPIMKFSTPTSTIIVLSSPNVAQELLDKRGSMSADRPPMHMAKLAGWQWGISVLNNSPELRARRKIMHQYLDQRVIPNYEAQITLVALQLARRLLENPEDFFQHMKRASGANILRITYGIEVSEDNDPYIRIADDAMNAWAAVILPGAWAVDWIPILKYVPSWFPGASFKRYAEEQRKFPEDLRTVPFSQARSEMAQGCCPPYMVSETLPVDSEEELIEAVKDAAGFMYLGGVDTTAATMQCFFLAMVLHPDVHRAAQDELDRVIGRDRLPTFADYGSLPYVEAVILEVLRVYPPAPLGISHTLAEDDVYEGMFLRKGSTLVANIWRILRDPEAYPEPHMFKPGRFLRDGQIDKTVVDPRENVFGYGRRICSGQHLANASLFVEISIILSCFNISKAVENGKEITPSSEFHHSALSAPLPFRCSISPRSEKTAPLIAEALDAVM